MRARIRARGGQGREHADAVRVSESSSARQPSASLGTRLTALDAGAGFRQSRKTSCLAALSATSAGAACVALVKSFPVGYHRRGSDQDVARATSSGVRVSRFESPRWQCSKGRGNHLRARLAAASPGCRRLGGASALAWLECIRGMSRVASSESESRCRGGASRSAESQWRRSWQ
jgi:hypothetical protein